MVTSELPSWLQPTDGLADLVHGTDPRINDILAMVPSIRLGPVPPPFFRNRHIQFFPFLIQNEIHRREGIAFQRLHVTVSDCLNKTKDCIPSSSLHMTDTITLDVFPPFDDDDESPYRYSQGFNSSSPSFSLLQVSVAIHRTCLGILSFEGPMARDFVPL